MTAPDRIAQLEKIIDTAVLPMLADAGVDIKFVDVGPATVGRVIVVSTRDARATVINESPR